jgi:hypothetical protein
MGLTVHHSFAGLDDELEHWLAASPLSSELNALDHRALTIGRLKWCQPEAPWLSIPPTPAPLSR